MKFGKKQKLALLASLSASFVPSFAFAEVPASVTTAITTAVTDVGVIGAAVLGVIIAIMAFKWLRRSF